MKESSLSPTAKQFLKDMGCADIYGEVVDIDLVGINGNVIYGVELKTSLNIKVLEQARKRKDFCNYVYIIVPNNKLKKHYKMLSEVYRLFIDYHGLGLVGAYEVQTSKTEVYYTYQIHKHPKMNRHNIYKDTLKNNLIDLKKDHDGGLQSHEVQSPYSWMIEQVKEYLKWKRNIYHNNVRDDGWASLDEILKNCDRVRQHYANPKGSLRQTLRADFNKSWVEIKDKKYRIRELG